MDELLSLSATELIRCMRAREVSPLELVETHIARIEAVNPELNALVTSIFEQARAEARRATERLTRKREEVPPLFGLPVTVKDALAVAGIRFTAGAWIHRERIADADAEAVRRFKDAGAILLGKTNCPDLCCAVETDNPIFGLTRNPWNLSHSAGGSSGGEGALIAAGGSPLGLGTDIAGSIRTPCAFCGTCGLKPSAGRISTAGHDPVAPPAIAHWNTVGPLARRVEDLALALSVLSQTPVRDYTQILLVGRRLIVPQLIPGTMVKREIINALAMASRAFKEAGLNTVEGVKLPVFKLAFEIVAVTDRELMPLIRRELSGGQSIYLLPELLATWRGHGRVSSPVLSIMSSFSLLGPLARLAGYGNMKHIDELRLQVLDLMGEGGLMLLPVYASPAPRHGFSWGPYGMPSYTVAMNALGFPSVALPVGWSDEGLPLGVQVVGRPGDDEVALAAAAVLEQAFGGWRLAAL